jgi:hypothetical protein
MRLRRPAAISCSTSSSRGVRSNPCREPGAGAWESPAPCRSADADSEQGGLGRDQGVLPQLGAAVGGEPAEPLVAEPAPHRGHLRTAATSAS